MRSSSQGSALMSNAFSFARSFKSLRSKATIHSLTTLFTTIQHHSCSTRNYLVARVEYPIASCENSVNPFCRNGATIYTDAHNSIAGQSDRVMDAQGLHGNSLTGEAIDHK